MDFGLILLIMKWIIHGAIALAAVVGLIGLIGVLLCFLWEVFKTYRKSELSILKGMDWLFSKGPLGVTAGILIASMMACAVVTGGAFLLGFPIH